MMTQATTQPNFNNWLQSVHRHIEDRRSERRTMPKPQRNRDRERARREARALFRAYYSELEASVLAG